MGLQPVRNRSSLKGRTLRGQVGAVVRRLTGRTKSTTSARSRIAVRGPENPTTSLRYALGRLHGSPARTWALRVRVVWLGDLTWERRELRLHSPHRLPNGGEGMMMESRTSRVLLIDSVGEIEGGTQMMLDELLHRADRDRVSVSFACLRDGSWPRALQAEGYPANVVPRTRWRDVGNVVQVARRLREIIRRDGIDLVHASENSTFLYASLAARWARVPVVWLVFDPLTAASRRRQMTARLLGSLRPDWIIFGTTEADGGVPRGPSIPTSTILPGVDVDRCRSGDGRRARRELGIPDGAPVVATFGRLDPFKAQLIFVQAMERVRETHPEVRGVICGWENDSNYSRRVRDLLSKLGLEETVMVTGFVSDSLKDDVLAAADVVVHVASREPFGLAVAEAMAAGKAVVAAAATGPRSLIEDGVTGVLVPIGAAPAVAAAIERLLGDPGERAKLGAQAAVAARQYSLEHMVRRIEQVWDTVLSDRGTRSSRT